MTPDLRGGEVRGDGVVMVPSKLRLAGKWERAFCGSLNLPLPPFQAFALGYGHRPEFVSFLLLQPCSQCLFLWEALPDAPAGSPLPPLGVSPRTQALSVSPVRTRTTRLAKTWSRALLPCGPGSPEEAEPPWAILLWLRAGSGLSWWGAILPSVPVSPSACGKPGPAL